MIRISLNASEREELARLRLQRSSNVGERAYYVLLADSGKSAPEIAKHLKRNYHHTLMASSLHGGRSFWSYESTTTCSRALTTSEQQRQWLLNAIKQVPEGQILIPKEKSYKNHLAQYQEVTAKMSLSKCHGLRHAYAQGRYHEITKSYDKTGQGLISLQRT